MYKASLDLARRVYDAVKFRNSALRIQLSTSFGSDDEDDGPVDLGGGTAALPKGKAAKAKKRASHSCWRCWRCCCGTAHFARVLRCSSTVTLPCAGVPRSSLTLLCDICG